MEKLNDCEAPAVIVKEPEGWAITPDGKPESVTVTDPVNPFRGTTDMETRALELPSVASSCAGEIESEKSSTVGGGA